MSKKTSTEYLYNQLVNAKSLDSFEDEFSKGVKHTSFEHLLLAHIAEKQVTPQQVIDQSNMTKSHYYQLVNGQRQASRDKVIALGLALKLSPDHVNQLLKAAQKSSLYVKDPRDATLIYALINHMSLVEANILLSDKGHHLL